MMYYLDLMFALILGQTFLAAIVSWYYQRKNEKIDYYTAFKLYVKKNFGTFVVIVSFTTMVMFVLPDWFDLQLTKAELAAKESLSKFEAVQMRFRTWVCGYGIFVQWIADLAYKGGRNAIARYGKQKGIETNNEEI